MPFKVKISLTNLPTNKSVFGRINDEFLSAAAELTDDLERLSPVGATGDLRSSWAVIPSSGGDGELPISVRIANDAPDSLRRVAGSPPGTRADLRDLQRWVEAKRIANGSNARQVAVAIRRNIKEDGTQRWREGGNQDMGIGRKGEPLKNGLIDDAVEQLARNINRINFN